MNLATKIFQATAPNKEMPGDVFEALIQKAKFEQQSDTHYGYRCKHNNYEIDFAMLDGNLDIDCFGFNHGKGWLELEPNDSQINAMLNKLNKTVLYSEVEADRYEDPTWENGVSGKDFY